MNALSCKKSLIRRPAPGRLLLIGFMLLAFIVQGYATQTHIHNESFAAAGILVKSSGAPGHDNYPANDDPANCPICQQILQAGQFVAPTWLIPLLMTLAISVIEFTILAVPRYDAVSHNWRSRGPPAH
jgi:hypothetical protein